MTIKQSLDILGKEFVKQLQINLKNEGKYATGDLINSIGYQVVETANGWELEITSLDYLTYVDEGRKPGKMPPTKPIRKWIDDKKISVIGSKDSAAFLIARSIGEKGIKPTNVIDKTIKQVMSRQEQILTDAIAEETMKELFKGLDIK